VFSLGVVTLEMVDGQPPWANCSGMQAMVKIMREGVGELKHPEWMSDNLQAFVKRCTHMNPDDRPTSHELLEDSFLATVSNGVSDLSGSLENLQEFVDAGRESAKRRKENEKDEEEDSDSDSSDVEQGHDVIPTW
jgi:serine/threonine protein kinase